MHLPKGSAIQGQGAGISPASPSALSFLEPTGSSCFSFQTHQNVLLFVFCPNPLTFQACFPICETGTIRASTSLGCFEGSVRAHQESTSPAPTRHAASSPSLYRRKCERAASHVAGSVAGTLLCLPLPRSNSPSFVSLRVTAGVWYNGDS